MKLQKQRKKPNNAVILLTGVLLASALAGCSETAQQPASVTKPIASKPSQTVSSLGTSTTPTTQEQPAYVYNPQGRRDPFAPLIVREEKRAVAGALPPLQRYNLYELKLTGIVWGGFGYNAMVEAPDGKGYFVRTGTPIGLNKGVVKKITQDQMIIEEKFKTFSGETKSKEIIIELRKKQEDLP